MDMRNVAVGVVMEVIATTMAPQAPDEETTLPTLGHDNTAIVLDCPHAGYLGTGSLDVAGRLRFTIADDSEPGLPIGQCEPPVSPYAGAPGESAVAA